MQAIDASIFGVIVTDNTFNISKTFNALYRAKNPIWRRYKGFPCYRMGYSLMNSCCCAVTSVYKIELPIISLV